jgi:hypothetical protein
MIDDSLTLALDGEVTLRDFDAALAAFRRMLDAVGHQVMGRDRRVEWVIDDLERSSAITSVRPRAMNDHDWESFAQVVVRVNDVGEAMAENRVEQLPARVSGPARKLAGLVDGGVERLRLVTVLGEHYIERPPSALTRSEPAMAPRSALGEVTGRLQTLSNRGGLRFTLYDLLHDKAVTGYLEPGNEDLLKDLWGKLVAVDGIVTRDPSGRPTSVRRVRAVRPVPELPRGAYREARGALAWHSPKRPEDVIREMRDSG